MLHFSIYLTKLSILWNLLKTTYTHGKFFVMDHGTKFEAKFPGISRAHTVSEFMKYFLEVFFSCVTCLPCLKSNAMSEPHFSVSSRKINKHFVPEKKDLFPIGIQRWFQKISCAASIAY